MIFGPGSNSNGFNLITEMKRFREGRFFMLLALFLFSASIISCRNHSPDSDPVRNTNLIHIADSINHFNPLAADSLYKIVLKDSSGENLSNYVNALVGVSLVYSNRGVFDTARLYLNRAFHLSNLMKDTSLTLKTLLTRGNLNLELGDMEGVEQCYREGYKLAIDSRNIKSQQIFLLNIGNIEQTRGDYPAAIKTFTEGIRMAETSGDEETLAIALENLAITLRYSGALKEAISYINQALRIRKKLNLNREYAKGMINLGVFYRNYGNNDSALHAYREAYAIFSDLNDSLSIIKVRYNIGIILKNQGKFSESEKEMTDILEFCKQNHIIDGQSFALSALSSIYEQTGRQATALAVIDSSIVLAKRYRLTESMTSLLDQRALILAKLGRYHEAYLCSLEEKAVSDSLLSAERQKEIETLKIRFETEHKEAENSFLKTDLEVKNTRLQLSRLGLIAGFIIFVIMIFLLRLRQKQLKQEKLLAKETFKRAEQEKKNREIELEKVKLEKLLQDKELETLQLEASIKEEQIEQMVFDSKLQEQKLVFESLVHAELTQINRSIFEKLNPYRLKFSRKKDQDDFAKALTDLTREALKNPMAEFEILFRQIHGSFYEKLLQHCPSLSKSELNICAFIRLNLSSKDISRITNLSVATIETTRHHIRKKLNLEPGDNLTSFMIAL